ncbi:MAG: D-Ala-D-Ala carboxypeptidase family metallohydrolase, partial [Aeromonas sp.]
FSVAAKESTRSTAFTGVVNWEDPHCKVSNFFTVGEVTKGDPDRIPIAHSEESKNILKLAAELDKLREAWGSSIGVTSWYRPYAINLAVGGVSNSTHISGGAADIYTPDGRDAEFEAFIDKYWGGGVGYGVSSGRGFTHIDLFGGGGHGGAGGFDSGAFAVRWTY